MAVTAPANAAPDEASVHGVLLAVHGVGVLLTGDPGCGKSTLALELLDRGQRLVSDDAPLLRVTTDGRLEGRSSVLLRGLLRVRGLGVIDIERQFGAKALTGSRPLDLAIRLCADVSSAGDIPAGCCELLGVALPELRLVASPGLNRAVWVECAVRRRRLVSQGHDAERELALRQAVAIAGRTPCA